MMLFANDRDGDHANPQNHPKRYLKVRCAQCRECWFDKLFGKCFAGGPYDPDMHVSASHCPAI